MRSYVLRRGSLRTRGWRFLTVNRKWLFELTATITSTTLDDKFLQLIRARAGLGYIVNKTWRVEFIYHAEFSGAKGQPKNYTGNIWRLSIKLNLPRRGKRNQQQVPDIDE